MIWTRDASVQQDILQVADSGFRQEDFDLVAGQTKYKLDRVAPGANASHTVVVRPKKFGYFNFTAAEVFENEWLTWGMGVGGAVKTVLLQKELEVIILMQVTYSAGESAGTVVSFYAGPNYSFQKRFGIGRERYRLSCRVVT